MSPLGACSAWDGHYARRCPMKWKRIILAAVLLPVGVLTVLNVRDYRRYKFITELERHVTPEQFAAMARVCEEKGRQASAEFSRVEFAPEFAVLRPLAMYASIRGLIVKLYEQGDARAVLHVAASSRNQCADVSYDFFGESKWHEVWMKSPDAEAPFRPRNRVLTVSVSFLGKHIEYIVTRDALLVLSHVNGWPEIVARRDLSESDVGGLREVIGRIPREKQGKAYKMVDRGECNVEFRFSEDGARSSEDIMLVDAWCDAVTEVVAVVSALAPSEFPVPRELIQRSDLGWKPKVVPIADAEKSDEPLHYPLWLIWPRIVRTFE